MIKTVVPTISDELAFLWEESSWEDKMKLNGYMPEQRLLIITELHKEIAVQYDEDFKFLANKLHQEAIQLLLQLGEVVFKESHPEFLQAMPLARTNAQMKEMLIKLSMSWTPDWEKAINGLAGETFEFSQNQFYVVRYHEGEGEHKRSRAIAVCEVIGHLDPNSDRFSEILPNMEVGKKVGMSALQLEIALERRLA